MSNITLFRLLLCLSLLTGCISDDTQDTEDDTQDTENGRPTAAKLSVELDGIKTFHFSWQPVESATHYQLWEDPDGTTGTADLELVVEHLAEDVTNFSLPVPLYGRFHSEYLLSSCNAEGCTDSNAASPDTSDHFTKAIGYFEASNADKNDQFGNAISLNKDGTLMAVGAKLEDGSAHSSGAPDYDNDVGTSGAVYLYRQVANGSWLETYLKSDEPITNARFGASVGFAADSNLLAVGETYGAVYLYAQGSDLEWVQIEKLKGGNTEKFDLFGQSISLSASGDVLAVGAPYEDGDKNSTAQVPNNNNGNAGAVYIFVRDDVGGWSQQAYLKASNAASGAYFGNSVSLDADGRVLAVGAENEDGSDAGVVDVPENDQSLSNSGAVYLFTFDETQGWQQAPHYFKASNPGEDDFFGYSVSLSADGTRLAVGAPEEDGAGDGVFAIPDDLNEAPDSGAVYVFQQDENKVWGTPTYLKAENSDAGDSFGFSVHFSADASRLVVGAANDVENMVLGESSNALGINGNGDDNSTPGAGAVYSYVFRDNQWQSEAYIKAPVTEERDEFGIAVTLSGDGNSLAVGARYKAGSDNQERAGTVYLY